MRVAAIQLEVSDDESSEGRRRRAFGQVRDEAARGADLVVLPELWSEGFFSFDGYAERAEPLDGPLGSALADLARECGVVLAGGSFVERDGDDLYNTAVLFDRDGRRLAA